MLNKYMRNQRMNSLLCLSYLGWAVHGCYLEENLPFSWLSHTNSLGIVSKYFFPCPISKSILILEKDLSSFSGPSSSSPHYPVGLFLTLFLLLGCWLHLGGAPSMFLRFCVSFEGSYIFQSLQSVTSMIQTSPC